MLIHKKASKKLIAESIYLNNIRRPHIAINKDTGGSVINKKSLLPEAIGISLKNVNLF